MSAFRFTSNLNTPNLKDSQTFSIHIDGSGTTLYMDWTFHPMDRSTGGSGFCEGIARRNKKYNKIESGSSNGGHWI